MGDTVEAMWAGLLVARKVFLFPVSSDVSIGSIVRIEVMEEAFTRRCHRYW